MSFEITHTNDIYTQAAMPVTKYVVVPKAIKIVGDTIQIVPMCTRAFVDGLPSLCEDQYEDPPVSTAPSCLYSHPLKSEIAELKLENAKLMALLDNLIMDSAIDAGRMAEIVVRNLLGGTSKDYNSPYGIKVGEHRIEVKYSKLNTPHKHSPKKRRWNWSNIKAKDKGRGYHFLILLGEKDMNYPSQYLDADTTPYGKYVCFFIPRQDVTELMPEGKDSGMIDTNTDREKVGSSKSKKYSKSKKLWGHMGRLEDLPTLIKDWKAEGKPS